MTIDWNETVTVLDGPEVTVSAESGSEALVEGSVDQLELIPFQLKDQDFIQVAPSETLESDLQSIPDQMAFKIGTAADLVGVKPYVLRFWESEFEGLRPKKSQKGQRAYSRRDIETAMMIKKLLYEDRFSIEGARSKLKELRSKVKETRHDREELNRLKTETLGQVDRVRASAIQELRMVLGEISRISSLFSA